MQSTDEQPTVFLVETSPGRWEIQTKSGYVIKDSIYLAVPSDAEAYVKAYLSSYMNWQYKLKPFTKDVK